MKGILPLRSGILFLGLPALWLVSASLASQANPPLDLDELTFIPVAVHAAYSANYSVDKSIRFTPIEEDILNDAQGDQGLAQPTSPSSGGAPVPQTRGTGSTDINGNKGKSTNSPGHSGDEHGNGKNK